MKRILLIFAAIFAAMSTAAQVGWNVNDPAMGVVRCIHPVIHIDSVLIYDTVMVCDTTGEIADTGYVYDTISAIDTTYNNNQWFLIADANDGCVFSHWINIYGSSDTAISDTVLSDFNLIDITGLDYDTITCIAYFETINNIMRTGNIHGVKVYPNPATSVVRLSQFVGEYWLYNECGKGVICGVNTNTIDMTPYPSGVYFLKTRAGVTKIIKK